jgi:FdhD protein
MVYENRITMTDRTTIKNPGTFSLADVEPAVQTPIERLTAAGTTTAEADWVASEAPVEVRLNGKPTTVLMRTPGHDEELIRGFLFSEGIATAANEIRGIRLRHTAEDFRGSVADVELAPMHRGRTVDRAFYSNASCGVCGKKTIASLEVRGPIASTGMRVNRSVLEAMPAALRAGQGTFAKTGGVHASGLFTPDGRLLVLREDVGRHNALDKIIGWALSEGTLPLTERVLLVSGRVSYEIVQKAVVAGIPFIAAVGAPSSLAVDLARRFQLTLVGFLKPGSLNVYSHGERIAGL